MDASPPAPELEGPDAGLPRPGEVVLGKYLVEGVIGRGGMGVVYAARHEALHQKVALKVLSPLAAKYPGAAARFLNEARAAARIKDEHVAAVSDVGQLESGVPYMVLEHLEGKDLSRLLEERGPLPASDAADYVVQALSAIAQAHAAGIVHRDLKPGNLFLAELPDGRTTLKVLDFGISKVEAVANAELTHTAAVLGSPSYMAPEQVRSSKSVDGRADIWSLGVILYRLLSGHGPFSGDTVGEVLAAVLEKTPSPLRELRPDVPEGLERVIARCLEKDRDARWASAAELASALAPFASPDYQRLAERIARAPATSISRVAASRASSSSPTPMHTPFRATEPAPSTSRPSRSQSSINVQATKIEPAFARSKKPWGGRRALGVLAATAVLVVAAVLVVHGRKTDAATGPGAPASASASPDATRWFERSPKGASDKYALGLRALRDGFEYEAADAFQGATQDDVWLASAYLRHSIIKLLRFPAEARVDFAHAVEHQDRLDARDVQLLDAFRHQALETPPDDAAWEDALARLSDLHPTDAELAFYLGFARSFRGENDQATLAYQRAIANDPQFGWALAGLAADSIELGDLERAKNAVDQCLALPRRSPACLRQHMRLLSFAGDAAGVLAEADAWIKTDPLHPGEPDQYKAEAMFALGSSIPAVEEVVRQRTRGLGEERSRTKLFWAREMAELKGDFAAAETALKGQRDFANDSSLERRDHAAAAMALVDFYGETGRYAEGAAVAADYLAKETAWASDRSPPQSVLEVDPVPRLLAAQLRAKTIDKAAFDAALAAWASRWKAALPPHHAPKIWVFGYAAIATTKVLADDALAARARFDASADPTPPLVEQEVALGRMYAMAGDYERARPHLERAIHSVWTLHTLIDETQAEALYGETLEKSDEVAACLAYDTVLARWGGVKASITAARVAARSRALKCPPVTK